MNIKKNSFKTEMEAEEWMTNNCLENGYYRYENGEWVVYDWNGQDD